MAAARVLRQQYQRPTDSGAGAGTDRHDELVYVILGSVEGSHPADNAFLLIPDVESPVPLKGCDPTRAKGSEYGVRLDRIPDGYARRFLYTCSQPAGHRIGMLRGAKPQLVLKQGAELSRHEAHLRAQLHLLLAQERNVSKEIVPHHDHRLCRDGTVLGPAEAEHIGVSRKISEFAAEVRSCVRESRAVHIEVQTFSPAELGQQPQVRERVTGADLSYLGNLDDPRLRSVLVAPSGKP